MPLSSQLANETMYMHSSFFAFAPCLGSNWLTHDHPCAGKPKHDPKGHYGHAKAAKHEHKGHYGKPKHDPKGHYGHAKPAKHEHKGHYGALPAVCKRPSMYDRSVYLCCAVGVRVCTFMAESPHERGLSLRESAKGI